MRKALVIGLVALLAPHAWAKGNKDKSEDEEESSDDDSSSDDEDTTDEDQTPKKKEPPKKEKQEAADEDEAKQPELKKQDLTGHDLGTGKKATSFEKQRFFVDKADTEKTEKGTLVQGSITSSSFLYTEAGGPYPVAMQGNDSAAFSRIFTDLRLQTDFRHISGSRWEGRVDARLRLVNSPSPVATTGFQPTDGTHVQSGLTGQNEYELRELWLIRNGERTDVILGRQFIPDLGAIKIDGLRIDYASSERFTLLGFGGLYPFRGSRSLTTDYPDLKTRDAAGNLVPAGQFVGAGGFGAAYRTANAYGSFGGVVLYPLEKEQPRVYATSTGYWRYGSKLDFYHFAIIDLVGSNAVNNGLTNLSGGVNYKPSQRLRLTGSVNRVDTDTLNIQANAFLANPQQNSVIQNEVYVARLATTQLRGSVSASLGELQRFEVTAALAYRSRPGFTLTDGMSQINIQGAHGAEVYGSITDRRSIKDARLSVDIVRTFGVGTVAYQRSEVFAIRGSAAHDIMDGKGEWEAEISYATTKDSSLNGTCDGGTGDAPSALSNIPVCFGATNGSIFSLGGSIYYRFNADWFGLGSLYLSRTDIVPAPLAMGAATMADPTITGLSGFGRIAYRF